jgi:hypothetical protein
MEPVAANVDQLPGHGIGAGVQRLAHGLVAAADRGQQQHCQYRVEQPTSAAAADLADAEEHPDNEREQDRRPCPGERSLDGGKPAE